MMLSKKEWDNLFKDAYLAWNRARRRRKEPRVDIRHMVTDSRKHWCWYCRNLDLINSSADDPYFFGDAGLMWHIRDELHKKHKMDQLKAALKAIGEIDEDI